MRQVWITKRGGTEVLEVRDAADPVPKPGEVRVRVRAAGVNFADILIRVGLYPDAPDLPAVIGYEVAGVVDAIGDETSSITLGTRVLALLPCYGGYSESVCVAAEEAVPIPDDLGFEKAAAIPVNYMTAWLMLLRLGNIQEGESVLIHAVAGGVGQAALQICQWKGASVIGTASAFKHERLKRAGVACCIDYHSQDFETEVLRWTDGKGVDVALDSLGGNSLARSYRCLAPLGRLCTFGVSSMVGGNRKNMVRVLKEWLRTPRFDPLKLLQESRGVFGVTLGSLKDDSTQRRQLLEQVLELVRERVFDPVVDRTFEFEEAGTAHRYLQEHRKFGKVVLTA